jgi:hypothetical protein
MGCNHAYRHVELDKESTDAGNDGDMVRCVEQKFLKMTKKTKISNGEFSAKNDMILSKKVSKDDVKIMSCT